MLITSRVGLFFGLSCLIQVLGGIHMNAPGTVASGLLVHGAGAWSVIPVAIMYQWILVGSIVGLIFHLGNKPKQFPLRPDTVPAIPRKRTPQCCAKDCATPNELFDRLRSASLTTSRNS